MLRRKYLFFGLWVLCAALLSLTTGSAEVKANKNTDSAKSASSKSATKASDATWSYEGSRGAAYWANLSPDYGMCSNGIQQSPVDIQDTRVDLSFHYKVSSLQMHNDGHGIQVKYDAGSHVKVDNKKYALTELSFHRPSEHTLNGRRFPMEVQFVHKSKQGKLAVVAVFLKQGARNPFIDTLWANMPRTAHSQEALKYVTINAEALLPADRRFYNYMGSLTRPPCSEDVQWFVLQEAIEISSSQITAFSNLYANNARPIQPLNKRHVKG